MPGVALEQSSHRDSPDSAPRIQPTADLSGHRETLVIIHCSSTERRTRRRQAFEYRIDNVMTAEEFTEEKFR